MGRVYVPSAEGGFKTEELGLFDWFFVVGISSLPLWVMEAVSTTTGGARPL